MLTKKKKNKSSNKTKKFLYNPNNPKKSFDVYIDKDPSDTIPIKYTTIDDVNPPVELKVSLNSGAFTPGEEIVGGISSARYVCLSYSTDSVDDLYDSNAEIELEADNLLDFTEGNPFGDY